MDCERFDRIVLDLLYDELDELTAAAARRHLDHCARCRGILAGLRATREVGALPLVDPPDGLELRIIEAERQVRGHLPLRQRAGRAVSMLAGYAMRPQLAMAATLLLLIGVGLIFFRGKPSDRDTVSVTERGVAESDPETVTVLPKGAARASGDGALASAGPVGERKEAPVAAAAPKPAAPAAEAAPAVMGERASDEGSGADAIYQAALAAYRAGRYKEARQQFEGVVARGGARAPDAALYAAQATKNGDGCGSAASLFDQVSQHYPGSRAGYEATWQAAGCYEVLGDLEKARRSYQALLDDTTYAPRARAALAQLDKVEGSSQVAARAAASKRAVSSPAAGSEPPAAPSSSAAAIPKAAGSPRANGWRQEPAPAKPNADVGF